MIKGNDFYNVMSAMVPLYVAMVLAYASVRWWRIFTAEQCSGINRFVATFAVPLLSFHFISANDPYKMNFIFVAADTLQKIIILVVLAVAAALLRRRSEIAGSSPFEWAITIFSLATLPNTLVMGIPLLEAMYGVASGAGSLMVQVVVLQAIVWYTLLLFLFEFRGAWTLIAERFPETAASIASFTVESDVVSLDCREPLDTDAQVLADGRLHITVRRSTSSGTGPRFSSLAGAEIYSVSSPESNYRGSNFNHAELYRKSGFGPADLFYSDQSPPGPTTTPRHSNFELERGLYSGRMIRSGTTNSLYPYPGPNPEYAGVRSKSSGYRYGQLQRVASSGGKDLHMFKWSMRESPAPLVGGGGGVAVVGHRPLTRETKEGQEGEFPVVVVAGGGGDEDGAAADRTAGSQMPPATVMAKLILVMVWRKLVRNPNTYSSIIGLVWSLIAYRWNVAMPKIIANSISILSNTGLGMAMFSLGLFMAMQPKLIACGNRLALFSMAVRFIVGPLVAAVASAAIGIRGNLLRISIVQAALPQGIVPFVFAKEYNNHSTVLSTAVIFGMLVALPIDLIYYIVLELF